ncbi:MAG: substrate-binding domain-containing protein [Candidatus Ornithomonoglobus sp.]
MKRRKKVICLICMAALLGLCGCGTDQAMNANTPTDGLDKLGDIAVISREEGSGTRSSFASLLGLEADNPDFGKTDMTTEDAIIADNADAVISEVENNIGAIGYVSAGALDGTENVKVLSVDNADENDKQYLLNRSFYLAYCGSLNDLESDFLTYVHGAGQELVGKAYTPVAKSGTFLSNKAGGTISINGSTSAAPLVSELAEEYMKLNPNAVISVTQSDSTQGLNSAMSGQYDFGMSSRDLKDYELELLDYEIIAEDSIAVIVNNDNPLENITSASLKDIYAGSITQWEKLK